MQTTIAPLWETMPSANVNGAAQPAQQKSDPTDLFGDIFTTAIDAVKETDAEKNQTQYLLATGQLDNPAALTIASTKAQLSVDLLVQLRNKAMDAYNELMRLSV